MPVRSAGILLWRFTPCAHGSGDELQVLIAHMGGPLWSRRDEAAWSVPKGEYEPGETAEDAARREFREELGLPLPDGTWVDLGEVKQSSGKIVTVWALEADLDTTQVVPGTFQMEWPKGSGVMREFPEVDRAAWFDLATARDKLVKAQRDFLDRLAERL